MSQTEESTVQLNPVLKTAQEQFNELLNDIDGANTRNVRFGIAKLLGKLEEEDMTDEQMLATCSNIAALSAAFAHLFLKEQEEPVNKPVAKSGSGGGSKAENSNNGKDKPDNVAGVTKGVHPDRHITVNKIISYWHAPYNVGEALMSLSKYCFNGKVEQLEAAAEKLRVEAEYQKKLDHDL